IRRLCPAPVQLFRQIIFLTQGALRCLCNLRTHPIRLNCPFAHLFVERESSEAKAGGRRSHYVFRGCAINLSLGGCAYFERALLLNRLPGNFTDKFEWSSTNRLHDPPLFFSFDTF